MNEWTLFQNSSKRINVSNKTSRVIVKKIVEASEEFFLIKEKIRPSQTRLIKNKLALLGKYKYNYSVYANGLSPELRQINGGDFKNSEWLYDMHWYVDGKSEYTTLRLPLVMECEWQQKRKGDRKVAFSGIKYDFQKLLVSNAELRLMIFKIIKPVDFIHLSEYFEGNIKNYKNLSKGAAFLFIAFHQRTNTFYYREIIK